MILKALEMQGFKSFPEKTTLSFGKGITAVVGPNGSGKSNISDAVRWVLGEQSTKSLRGSKMEDVIFDGTKVRKAYGFALVTLRLDNTDRSISSIDEDEVAVTRKYYRSGESEYKINGKNVRLRDVHELFMDTGLGRDGYSMVSQGKIADMISGKGNECREMLEEAAGISAYRYRRADSIKKLDKAEENLIRLRDILSELESRIGPLKVQSEKAEKFLVLAEQRKTLEIGLWLYNIDKLRTLLKKQDDSIAIADAHYEAVVKEIAELEEKIEQSISLSQNITAEIDTLRLSIADNEQKASAFDADCAVLEGTIEHNNDTVSRIVRDKDSSAQTREQLEREIKSDEKLIAQIKAVQKQKNEKYAQIEKSLENQKLLGTDIDKKSAELYSSVSENTKKLAQYRIAESTAKSSIDEISSRNSLLSAALSQRQAELKTLEREKKEAEKSLSHTKEEITSLSNVIDGLSLKYNIKNEKADKLKKELDDLSFEVSHLASKAKMLEDLEKSMEGYSGAVKAVIKAKDKGELDGIHSTVSKLISTDEEYTVAIETALGNAVQNIVCSSESDAKRAIAMLKRNGSGRATFLPLTSVKGRKLDEKGLDG
ncbi:MAG: chromosome segregation SMC family protein, partial [Acutalibacteraceae bacterium]